MKKNKSVKTIKFKVKDNNLCPITKDVINEYKKYYNTCSIWIKNNLTSMTIGEMGKFLQELTGKNTKYINIALSEEWKDKHMYHLFTKEFKDEESANALLYYYMRENKLDGYNGNILNIYDTYYREKGYYKNLAANYRTSIRELNYKIKRKNIGEDSTLEEIENQVIYEIIKNDLNKKSDWDSYISYIENVETPNVKNINRFKLLQNYFCNNEDVIKNKIKLLTIDQLKDFKGCIMKPHINSMTINIKNLKINEKENTLGFILNIPAHGQKYQIELWGNRQIKKGTKEDYETLVDFINTNGENVTFNIIQKKKKNEMIVSLSYKCECVKKEVNFENPVGLDINFKHAFFVSSEKDKNQLDGYINLYKYILNQNEFTSLLTKEERKQYEEIAEVITFCPIESDLLFTRYDKTSKLRQKEQVLSKILYSLQEKLKNENRIQEYIYVSCVNKIRAKYMSYFILKEKYFEKQQEYDIAMGFVDNSTENKDSMDKRRFEHPFINTDVANELLEKLNNVKQDIKGCMKNIIIYTYKLFEKNGYSIIALENLINSNFEKTHFLPKINNLLDYHKLKNQNINDIKVNDRINGFIEKGYFEFITDENDKIIDAKYSPKGIIKIKKENFYNLMFKTLNFASIKDEFISLSNNGKSQIALVPSEYTSQMDSIDHCIYMIKNKEGKIVKVDKRKIRPSQEKHINGLNADYNAANNIKYIVKNEKWRNIFCVYNKKLEYNKPVLDVTTKGQFRILEELKKINAMKLLEMEKSY